MKYERTIIFTAGIFAFYLFVQGEHALSFVIALMLFVEGVVAPLQKRYEENAEVLVADTLSIVAALVAFGVLLSYRPDFHQLHNTFLTTASPSIEPSRFRELAFNASDLYPAAIFYVLARVCWWAIHKWAEGQRKDQSD